MKFTRLLSILALSWFVTGGAGCFDAADRQQFEALDRANIRWKASHLVYFKDPRTNLCFAYSSGEGLATVPCASIPRQLLGAPQAR